MGDDKGRVSAAGDDHIAEVAVILLDIALTRSESKALYTIFRLAKKNYDAEAGEHPSVRTATDHRGIGLS